MYACSARHSALRIQTKRHVGTGGDPRRRASVHPMAIPLGYRSEFTASANERLTLTTYNMFGGLCDVEASIFAPHELEYWRVPDGTRMPMTYDLNGSMETFGSQLTFVAPRAGTYRIRVRALELDCPRYRMTAARGATDQWTPLTPH